MVIIGQNIRVSCPHCGASIEVLPDEINCGIFRHGAFVDTLEPLDPHAPKYVCELLVANGLIYGCGGPFRLVEDASGGMAAIVCEYL